MAPKSPLQAGVILRAAEEIPHQLPEYWAAAHELNHASGDRAAQEGSTIETPHNARREFQFRTKGRLHPSRVLLRAAFREGAAQQFARANGIEKAFAREGIDPGGGISDERPVIPFKMRQELDGDGVAGLRHEIALRHLQLVAL